MEIDSANNNKVEFENNEYIRTINLNKHYSYNSKVLNSLNINIEKGKIYALLGESGCGKTTLLKCIIGILPIDSGNVVIFGNKTNENYNCYRMDLTQLGFMPQETCLYDELTISETLYYFAKLNCMANSRIKARKKFLLSLLNLPKPSKLIKHLSTGQMKRVSFACSLIHEPTILMLDEPTVGLDPILRRKIWNYLIDLSTMKHTTIIITTHYIDEARYANMVGFMRNGRIIEENIPNQLLAKYNESVLEDVFYKICEAEDNANQVSCSSKLINEGETQAHDCIKSKLIQCEAFTSSAVTKIFNKKSIQTKLKSLNPLSLSCNRIGALLYKDAKKFQRNKSLLSIQLIVPLIQITLFCLCIGKVPVNLNVGYVNFDRPELPVNVGEAFIDALDSTTLNKIEFNDYHKAYEQLKNGDIWCLLTIDQNFTLDLLNSFNKKPFQHTYEKKIHIYMDNTNHQIAYTIRDTILIAIKNVIEKYSNLFAATNLNTDVTESLLDDNTDEEYDAVTTSTITNTSSQSTSYPVNFEKPVYGVQDPIFTHFMAPGIAMTVVFFLSVASTASNFVLERRLGLLERSYLCGIKTIELLISQVLIYSVLLIIQITIVLILLFLVFQLPLRGSLLLLTTLMFMQGLSGLSYGLLISSLGSTEESVIQLTLASFYPILLMSGIIWPIESQPAVLAQISKFLPLTFATDAFRCILEKGWNLFVFKVTLGFLSTFAWIAIFLTAFLFVFSLK